MSISTGWKMVLVAPRSGKHSATFEPKARTIESVWLLNHHLPPASRCKSAQTPTSWLSSRRRYGFPTPQDELQRSQAGRPVQHTAARRPARRPETPRSSRYLHPRLTGVSLLAAECPDSSLFRDVSVVVSRDQRRVLATAISASVSTITGWRTS